MALWDLSGAQRETIHEKIRSHKFLYTVSLKRELLSSPVLVSSAIHFCSMAYLLLRFILQQHVSFAVIQSIEWFMEDQAFSPSFDLAHSPSPQPPSPISKLSLFLSLPVLSNWRKRGEGVGEEPDHTTPRKHGPL